MIKTRYQHEHNSISVSLFKNFEMNGKTMERHTAEMGSRPQRD